MPATIESRRQHLVVADRVRLMRAQARGELRALPRREAAARVADMLDVVPYWLRSMRVAELLRRANGRQLVEWDWVERWLDRAGIRDQARRLERLTPRQRDVLRECLREWARGEGR